MTLSNDVIVYVRENWSQHSVEVHSHGDTTVTLSLPVELPELSELILELDRLFGASVDLKHNSSTEAASCLTVRLGRNREPLPEASLVAPVVTGAVALCAVCLAALNLPACAVFLNSTLASLTGQ